MLPGGRVVIGGGDGRVLVWDPAVPGVGPAELGRHSTSPVNAVTVLPGGQVVTAGEDGRVLVWDPAVPGADPAELGRHNSWIWTVAVLPGGQVVTGGEDVRVWDPASSEANIVQLGCSAAALAAAPLDAHTSCLAIAHHGTGFSTWSVRM
jgi:WD40 repeat protein